MDGEADRDVARRSLGDRLVELRKSAGLTQRELANQLHVERSYIAHSESGRMLPPARFWDSADQLLGARGALRELSAQARVSPSAVVGAEPDPDDWRPFAASSDQPSRGGARFDERSRRRTLEISRQFDAHASTSRLPYLEPVDKVGEVREFLDRAGQRVHLLTGVAGSGKSRLVAHLCRKLDALACFQLHSMADWERTGATLVDEILRYASTDPRHDALLTLERACADLDRPCLVVVDGIASQQNFTQIATELERILRQVTTPLLRFLLVVRTPPDVEFSAFPVLAASVYETAGRRTGTARTVARWTEAEAAHAWALATGESESSFAELPAALRKLAGTPLYLGLMVDFGRPDAQSGATAYRLVDHCVHAIVSRCGPAHPAVYRALAQAAGAEAADLVPERLAHSKGPALVPGVSPADLAHPALAPLLEVSASGRVEFGHEVIREYFIASRIAALVIERGRSQTIVAAFNDLARAAGASVSARNVLDFTIFALDERAPELLSTVALAPAVSAGSTLPPMISIAVEGARFSTAPVIRAAAGHCERDKHPGLVRELLRLPGLAGALGDHYAGWLLRLVRHYGSRVWPDIAHHLSRFPEAEGAALLRRTVDLDRAEDAVFVARHLDLFAGEDADGLELLEELCGSLDWRVRAALAGALDGDVAHRLVHDADYKVRAEAARVLAHRGGALMAGQLRELLLDPSWHVRAAALLGALDAAAQGDDLAPIHRFVLADPSWRDRPLHVDKLVERLALLSGTLGPSTGEGARSALLIVLHELRAGSLALPAELRDKLIAYAAAAPDWLVRAEVAKLSGDRASGMSPVESYRRMRGGRAVQIALDLHDLEHANAVAVAASEVGADLIEVGDPLIKSVGLGVITEIKRAVPETLVVAEMISADWGRDQVELAVEAGADIVLLIGLATTASVAEATNAARRLGVPVVLDIAGTQLNREWVSEMERAGVDGFAVTTNIDIGVSGGQPLDIARTVRSWTRLPVSVSGGFDVTDDAFAYNDDWDVIVVGRSVSEAIRPRESVRQILDLVHSRRGRGPDAGDPA